jgi:hypothetical protein
MPTTTNYGWTTPADTDLVKDGASAIRTLGTAIDTTVFNNASAGIAKTIVDAKGDIIAATAADTVARLAVGANDTVLTADSSTATGLKWAAVAGGGMTLISTTTLSGTTVTLSSIPQTYNSLKLILSGLTWDTTNALPSLRFNGATTGTSFGAVKNTAAYGRTNQEFWWNENNWVRTDTDNVSVITIDNYTSSTYIKALNFYNHFWNGSNYSAAIGGGAYRSTTAITSIDIYVEGYSFSAGQVLLYGVK